MGEDLLTLDEVATQLRVSRKTLINWRNRGFGPVGFRMGRAVVFERRDVVRWIAAQRASDPISSRNDAGARAG